jgi:Lambda phage tail tape-measure protein (Tape_meas_lam_C)
MANLLGSLFVELKANTANFVEGMSKASASAKSTGKDIEGSFRGLGGALSSALAPFGALGQQVASTLDSIGSSAGKAFSSVGKTSAGLATFAAAGAGVGVAAGAIGVGLFEAAQHAAEFGARIYDASEKTGLSAATLSGVAALAKETGNDFNLLTTALARGTVNFEKTAESGGKLNAELYQVMGGAKGVSDLGLKPMDDRIQTVLKRIFELNDVGQRNVALQELLGRGWQDNVETLKLLAEQGYGPAIEAAKKFGIFFDDEAARQAKQFAVQLAATKAEFEALALTVGRAVIPAFQGWMQGLQGIGPQLEALADHAKVVAFVLEGNFAGAAKAWRDASRPMREAVQAQTDFLVHTQNLTAGAKATADATDKLTTKVHEHRSALELAAEASRNFWEKFNAGVAEAMTKFPKVLDLFKELRDYQDEMDRKAGAAERKSMVEHLATGTTPGGPAVAATGLPPALAPAAPTAVMPLSTEELSVGMNRIMQAPPAVAASLDTLRAHFEGLFRNVEAEGKDFGPKVFESLSRAIDGVSTQLAELLVTGKSNFRQLFQSLTEEITKASIQNLIGKVAAPIANKLGFGNILGAKADGSPSAPFHVVIDSAAGGVFGGGAPSGVIASILGELGKGKETAPGGGFAIGALGNFDWTGSAGASASAEASGGGGLGALFASIGKAFGGFLQGGGDVTPGRAYVVGERAPEFFVPNAPGQIRPALAPAGRGPGAVVNNYFSGIKDVDLFRRSETQIMSQFHRQTAIAMSRGGWQ